MDGQGAETGTAVRPNRTRDHLANERTFLAWIRTALGLIGLGFVLARMGLFLRQLAAVGGEIDHHRIPVGGEFMATGILFLVAGTVLCTWSAWLYHRVRRAIDADDYEPATRAISVVAALIAIGGLAIVAMVAWRTVASGG